MKIFLRLFIHNDYILTIVRYYWIRRNNSQLEKYKGTIRPCLSIDDLKVNYLKACIKIICKSSQAYHSDKCKKEDYLVLKKTITALNDYNDLLSSSFGIPENKIISSI